MNITVTNNHLLLLLILLVILFNNRINSIQNKLTEPFNTSSAGPYDQQIKNAVKEIYLADVEAIRNLSNLAINLSQGGFTLPGNLTTTGLLTSQNGITNTGALSNTGNVTITGNLTNNGALTNNGNLQNTGTLTNTGNVTISGALTATGLLTTRNGIINTGPFTNTGVITNTGTLTNNGNVTISGNININGNGNIIANGTLYYSGQPCAVLHLKDSNNYLPVFSSIPNINTLFAGWEDNIVRVIILPGFTVLFFRDANYTNGSHTSGFSPLENKTRIPIIFNRDPSFNYYPYGHNSGPSSMRVTNNVTGVVLPDITSK